MVGGVSMVRVFSAVSQIELTGASAGRPNPPSSEVILIQSVKIEHKVCFYVKSQLER